jgi:hypothetical protein
MLRTLLALGLILLAASAEARRIVPKVQLEFELVDGSKICGQAVEAQPAIKLRTSVGEVRVPLVNLARVEVPIDGSEATLHLANGDRLKGTLLDGIEVNTLLGKLTIQLKVVKSLRVQPGVSKRLKIEGVSVSGSWAHQVPQNAVDNQPGAWSAGDYKGWYEIDLGSRREISRLSLTLQFDPTGQATHELYLSDAPMGANRTERKLLHRFSGERKDQEVLTFDCPPGTAGRYVQVHCPESRSWFNLIEFDVFGAE